MASAPESEKYFEWMIQLTRGQLLDLVLDIEERLLQLVRTVFTEAQGDWEKLIPGKIRVEIEQHGPPAKSSADLLDRASLGQLIGIVLASWKYFDQLLGDKQKFDVKANEFREWRNSLAHPKTLSVDEKVEIAVLIRQVGQQIPVVGAVTPPEPGKVVTGSTVLWVDDHPEWNLHERQVLRLLGIEVVPVLTNDEAVDIANQRSFDLVISDIDRGEEEAGDLLPNRLRALGVDVPIVFYVGAVDPGRGAPPGAASIQDDPALLVRDVLNLLSEGEARRA